MHYDNCLRSKRINFLLHCRACVRTMDNKQVLPQLKAFNNFINNWRKRAYAN